ncbi:MAG: hypothetical protein JXB04_11545 [Kiritimatiellae bacterium]|nr:hypothetical protein [Kiritimatiellia bacterium]
MWGFQLWANLPAAHKMMAPRYRGITADQIPEVTLESGITVKIICGQAGGAKGPVQDVVVAPEYYDVSVPANTRFAHPVARGHTALAYVVDGEEYEAGTFIKNK